MQPAYAAFLNDQLELADQLLAGRSSMPEPQDLPGRYGRVVRAIDHVLMVSGIPAVLGGGWAVWRHGYVGRVTQDLDIAIPEDRIDEFIRTASVAGFDSLPLKPGRWPKLLHRETGIQVDILPEGARPGTAGKLAPTTIPHPDTMGATPGRLRYMELPSLIVLKLAAGRGRDDADVIELLRANPEIVSSLREFATKAHSDYGAKFDLLSQRAKEQVDP